MLCAVVAAAAAVPDDRPRVPNRHSGPFVLDFGSAIDSENRSQRVRWKRVSTHGKRRIFIREDKFRQDQSCLPFGLCRQRSIHFRCHLIDCRSQFILTFLKPYLNADRTTVCDRERSDRWLTHIQTIGEKLNVVRISVVLGLKLGQT